MSSTRVPELTWFDLDDDIERYGMEAREAWSRMYPSDPIPPVDPTDGDWSWHGGSSNDLDSDPFVPPAVFDGDLRMGLDSTSMPISQTATDFQMLAPGMLPPPGPAEFYGAMPSGSRLLALNVGDPLVSYPWKSPSAPRSETIPLPPVVPWYDHQEWTSISVQEAGTSTGLAPAKPQNMKDNDQAEQPTPSTSRGRYDRTQNEEGKRLCLSHIRKALGIPSTQDELFTLRTLITHLGGNVPEREAPQGWQTKPQRLVKKRLELRECFDELRNIVSPQDTKLGDLKVLNRALALVISQAGGQRSSKGENQHYGVFRV